MMTTVAFRDLLAAGASPLSRTSRISSGRDSYTKHRTAEVIRPSTRPIARWMGCIRARKALKGSSVIPERVVSSTTEKAPSCRVTMQPMIEAAMMRFRRAALPEPNSLLRMIGRQIM